MRLLLVNSRGWDLAPSIVARCGRVKQLPGWLIRSTAGERGPGNAPWAAVAARSKLVHARIAMRGDAAMPVTTYARREAMGTSFEVFLAGDDEEHLAAVADAVLDEVVRVERLLSRFD